LGDERFKAAEIRVALEIRAKQRWSPAGLGKLIPATEVLTGAAISK
jgi:hypothetical protein